MHFLERAGVLTKGKIHDTQVMARLLLPQSASLKLKDLSTILIDNTANDAEQALKKWMTQEKRERKKQFTKILKDLGYMRKEYDQWKKDGTPLPTEVEKAEASFQFEPTYADVPKEIMEPYATGDVKYTLALMNLFMPKIERNQLLPSYQRDMRTLLHVYNWEKTGWAVDVRRLEEGYKHGSERINALRKELDELAEGLNPNSSEQVIEFFKKEGKKIPNAQADTLIKLDHPVANKITEIKGYEKMIGTYFKPILRKAKATGGTLHGGFNVAGPVTGRFSSSNPNLQNIPKEFKDQKVNIRYAFKPRANYILVFQDFSQMEVRIMAEYSKDEALMQAILNNEDLHTKTALSIDPRAKELYLPGVPKDEQPKEFQKIRSNAKQTTFGIFYGIGADKLSKQIGVSKEQARAYIQSFFNTYPGVHRFIQNVQRTAQSRPGRFVINKYGRVYWGEEDKEYALVDYLIQGTGADMMKIAIDRCEHILKGKHSHIISMIHDELVFEIHKSELDLIPLLHEQMTYFPEFSIPIEVDIEYSDTCWAEKKPWKDSLTV